MGQIEKGVILSLSNPDDNGNNSKASVQSTTAVGTSTLPLTIPWWLRGSMGNLSKGTEVVYALFNDASGLIISRMDGEWAGKMDDIGDIVVGNVTAQTIIAESVISQTVTAESVAAQSVEAKNVQDSGVVLHLHTHGGVVAGGDSTGKPN